MRKESKKLFNGNVEVRDYDVNACILKKENFEILHDGSIMTLSPEELMTKRVSISKLFKYDNRNYKLFGYVWNPDESKS